MVRIYNLSASRAGKSSSRTEAGVLGTTRSQTRSAQKQRIQKPKCPPGTHEWLKYQLESQQNREAILESYREVWGDPGTDRAVEQCRWLQAAINFLIKNTDPAHMKESWAARRAKHGGNP